MQQHLWQAEELGPAPSSGTSAALYNRYADLAYIIGAIEFYARGNRPHHPSQNPARAG
ncbi:hypothetical protein [Leptolyngbya sp. FACHB-261]|uniref:hypothetical protein n=1 Tax=Leptolyngbya sp. FACHB-261 TaxID=2692806 RepID=UPI0028C430C3|nr:hypothetical protein [Leptolyngbya sp. FACHB-261]